MTEEEILLSCEIVIHQLMTVKQQQRRNANTDDKQYYDVDLRELSELRQQVQFWRKTMEGGEEVKKKTFWHLPNWMPRNLRNFVYQFEPGLDRVLAHRSNEIARFIENSYDKDCTPDEVVSDVLFEAHLYGESVLRVLDRYYDEIVKGQYDG